MGQRFGKPLRYANVRRFCEMLVGVLTLQADVHDISVRQTAAILCFKGLLRLKVQQPLRYRRQEAGCMRQEIETAYMRIV